MLGHFPGLSLRSNPGLELVNAFGVFQTASLHTPLKEANNDFIETR